MGNSPRPVNSPHKGPVTRRKVSIWWRHHATCSPYITREGEVWGVFCGCSVWFTPFCHCYCKGVCNTMICLRDWSRSGGSYCNSTRLLSGVGTSREHGSTTDHEGVVAVTPDRSWSIPIITWLNNFVWNVFTTKYVQNLHQIERRRLLASTSCFLTTGIVALHTRREASESARNVVRHVKLCSQLIQEEWFVAIEIIYMESPITNQIFLRLCFKVHTQV